MPNGQGSIKGNKKLLQKHAITDYSIQVSFKSHNNKSFSYKINNRSGPGQAKVRAACQQDKLEFKVFLSPEIDQSFQLQSRSVRAEGFSPS